MGKYVTKSMSVRLYDGTTKRLKFYGRTEQEAQQKLMRAQIEYEGGLLVVNSQATFAKWADEWINTYIGRNNTTYSSKLSILNNHLVPYIGNLKLCEIRPIHLQKCINALEGRSKSLIQKVKIVLTNIIKTAVDNKLLSEDISKGLIWPVGTMEERRALTIWERQIFLRVLPRHSKGLLFALMYYAGLRAGEARALHWSNVDLENRLIKVTQAIKRETDKIGPPKSRAGKRTIRIHKDLLQLLENAPRKSMFVVPNEHGGYISKLCYQRAWRSFKRLMFLESGVPTYRNQIDPVLAQQSSINELTPYFLRHTFATMLAENNVPLKTAQYLLGHSNIAMTANIYTHASNKLIEQGYEMLDNMVMNPEENTEKPFVFVAQ